MATTSPTAMTHRFLGDSGLLVSKLALGSWMDDQPSFTTDLWYDIMKTAFANGINFFDTAECYAGGRSETKLGDAVKRGIAEGIWVREDLVITAKIFGGSKGMYTGGPNDQGLNRKHLIEGTKASLKRMQLKYVDVVFAHRPEPFTPLEETVRAMNFIIAQGWAFYWGTSEWTSAEIIEACAIADRLGMIRPIVEQAQYNMFERSKVDFEYAPLYTKYKLGLTAWSPLANGILTGKYSAKPSEGSRLADPAFRSWVPDFEDKVTKTRELKPIANKLGCSLAQLAIAWCVSNDHVSTVLLGARTAAQLEETVQAIRVVGKLTPEVKAEIDAIVHFVPKLSEPDHLCTIRERHLTGEQPELPAYAGSMD